MAAARWARARCLRRVATCSAHMSKARTIRLLPNLAIALRALRHAQIVRAPSLPSAESDSENFAAKARDKFLSLANFPLPLGHLQGRRGALFGVLHPPIEHRRLHAAREPHERARERDAHPTTIGCLVHPLGEAPEHGPLRHSRESRGQPAPVHASGLPLLDPSSRALRPRFAIASAQRSILPAIASQYGFSSALLVEALGEQWLGHSHRRASGMVRRRLLRSTTCNHPLNGE